jgi:hypothetical protein
MDLSGQSGSGGEEKKSLALVEIEPLSSEINIFTFIN